MQKFPLAAWLTLFLAGCGGAGPAAPTPSVKARIVIGGAPSYFVVGETVQLLATAIDQNGNEADVTEQASWSSSNPRVASVNGGTVSALSVGDVEITAGQSGVTASIRARVATEEDGRFRVAMLVGDTRAPTDSQIDRIFQRASEKLFSLTGVRMRLDSRRSVSPGPPIEHARLLMAASPTPAVDGVLGFFNDETARTFGGYSQIFLVPPPYVNRFPPAEPLAANHAYLAVVDMFQKYARCGYAEDDGPRVSPFSIGGECRGVAGVQCVFNGNYWMCPDSVSDPNADLEYKAACVVVHEFMHPFGSDGNSDHYGTPLCQSRTGMSAAEASDRVRGQDYCSMCPDLYSRFRRR